MKKLCIALGLAAVLVACGGRQTTTTPPPPPPGGGSTPPPAAAIKGQLNAIPGFGTSSSSAQTTQMRSEGPFSYLGMLMFRLGGGTSNIAISGTYSGFCSIASNSNSATYPYSPLYGLSTNNESDCANMYGSDPSTFQNVQMAIGDGTLTGIVAYGTGNGDSTDGQVIATVNGQAVALTCTLGTGPKCDATGSIPVLDGDKLGAVLKIGSSTAQYNNLRVVIVKQ